MAIVAIVFAILVTDTKIGDYMWVKRKEFEGLRSSVNYDLCFLKNEVKVKDNQINELNKRINLILSHFKLKEWTEAEKKVLITEKEFEKKPVTYSKTDFAKHAYNQAYPQKGTFGIFGF